MPAPDAVLAWALAGFAAAASAAAGAAPAKRVWTLERSVLSYSVSHPLHRVMGESRQARGKGECGEGGCEFLAAALIKSFISGDANRDAHMLQVSRGAAHPMAVVRLRLGEEPRGASFTADLELEFAGKSKAYPGVRCMVLERPENGLRVAGEIPLSLKDFDIEPPSLLMIPVKDVVPVHFETLWRLAPAKEGIPPNP